MAENVESDIERLPILQISQGVKSAVEDALARESAITIVLNNQGLVTLVCSPRDLEYLVVGFLSSEGFIESKDEIKKITVDEQTAVVLVETIEDKKFAPDVLSKRVITSGCGRGAAFYGLADAGSQKVESQIKISADAIFTLVKRFQHASVAYVTTHGVHSAALCDQRDIIVLSDDIGRHNAIDKIFGKCLLKDIPCRDRIILTSGRVSSEILHKVAKKAIPIIISISVPTDVGVRMADRLGVTLIGAVRGARRMNIYSNDWRVN